MSLYNLLHGTQPTAGVALAMLGIDPGNVPRFRDAYFTFHEDKPVVVIFTRTGGPNREDYAAGIDALTELPGYIFDEDDSFDCTYASFYFSVPAEYQERVITYLTEQGVPAEPADRMAAAIDNISSNPPKMDV